LTLLPTPRSHTSPLSLHDALPISLVADTVPDHREVRATPGRNLETTTRGLNLREVQDAVHGLQLTQVVEDLGGSAPSHGGGQGLDRKSTRLNSSHVKISYAVFCLK